MSKPPRYHLGGVRREDWIARRLAMLETRIRKDAAELHSLEKDYINPHAIPVVLILTKDEHTLLVDALTEHEDQIDADLEVTREDGDRPSELILTQRSTRIANLIVEVTR